MDADKTVLRLMMQVCCDTNFKIRLDGAIFFKNYLMENHKSLIGSTRLQHTYIPEICELINDEETSIKVEAIDSIQYILETLDVEIIEKEIIPSFLKLLNIENHDEVVERMSLIVGPIAFKLMTKDELHIKYQQNILEFYRATCVHKSDQCR